MKNIFILFSLVTMPFFVSAGEVQTAPFVDVGSYLGSWHEIASIPQIFQRNCAKNTVATYSLDSKGEVDVYNTCLTQDGRKIEATGKAVVKDTKTNAKLSVTFLKLGTWIYWLSGNYWILDVAPDYRYAIVGEGSRNYGWILSRTPRMSEEDLIHAVSVLKRNGYDLCEFNITPQDGGSPQALKLCDVLSK